VQFKANGTTVESGVLLSIGLSDLALKIGTDEFGVSITQGSVAIASLAPTARATRVAGWPSSPTT
jgi:hypothetical protein